MLTFTEQGIDADIIKRHPALFPDVWKKTKSWWHGSPRNILAKTWNCGQQIVAASSWMIGRISVACAIEYNAENRSCKVTISMDDFAFPNIEDRFAQALRIVLTSSNQSDESLFVPEDKIHSIKERRRSQLILGMIFLIIGFILTAIPLAAILSYPVTPAAYQVLTIGITLDVIGLGLLATSKR
ncbi:MAG: hypothetical protein ACXADD_14200 [Candidatus Thorarchaeota archaeon]|jgi:hypothetical protein